MARSALRKMARMGLLLAVSLIPACVLSQPLAHQEGAYHPVGPKILVTMASGKTFTITTDPQHSPKTVAHILELVNRGFYDKQRIHRVEYWVTQWGAPASKTEPLQIPGKDGKLEINPKVGDGGSGKDLPFEESNVEFFRGVVGIASNGLQMGGDSQVFVLKGPREYLYRSYAVVGLVTDGMDTVDGIKFGDRISKMTVLPLRRTMTPKRKN
jgi:cyclophilin family peptidyl-prolyl cis-trans isomerase